LFTGFATPDNPRLRTNIGKVTTLDDAVAFNRIERMKGKTIIRAHP
jgi:hypothetical protein